MGRNAICCGLAFAVVGFVFGLYTLSWGATSNLPAPLVLILCPAAILGALESQPDTDFLWLLMAMNAILYGVVGVLLANLLHLDRK